MNLLEQYHTLRTQRLALNAEADRLEQLEKDILYELTKDLNSEHDSYTKKESGYTFKATRKIVPNVVAWDQTLDYIRAEAAVDLLQKRLTESAVIARWNNQVAVPGIEKVVKWPVKVTKD